MDAGVYKRTFSRAGWVTKFITEKVAAVILDVGKIDHVLTEGMIHYHMMRFC